MGKPSPLLSVAIYGLGASALKNGLALTPQLGWNSWNSFGCNINQDVILDAAKKIILLGFKDLGYEYINLDDCWSSGRNSSGYLVADQERFPDGISGLAEKVHNMGLKVGIYSSAGTVTCAKEYPGSLGYEEKDAAVWASWGIDYLKYDNCFNEGQEGTPKLSYDRYNAMTKALNATGRPILYSMCNWGMDTAWSFAPTIANSWRITGDLTNVFDREDENCPCSELGGLDCKQAGAHCSIMNTVNKAVYFPSRAFKGAWNDLDLLQIGNGGLTDDESMSHFSLWAALKSPLILSNVMNKIDPSTLSILQNPAVLAVSQDPKGEPASRIWRYHVEDTNEYGKGEIQMYSGNLSGGDKLVLLLNAGSKDREMNATLVDIFWADGAAGSATEIKQGWDIYDLWADRMSHEQANAIIHNNGTMTFSKNTSSSFNITEMGGSKQVYSQVPPSSSRELMGSKVGVVQASGTVKAHVKSHGVAMLRLRAQKQSNDEL
ncbi:hypothetical protein ACN38_g6717 [Penicillium nordicum]|uniref:Alpha-galactosidase n=1 Tax=Penicillium nordicum TaxID=229535 RepID=A0A0M8P7N7_9EURO|nr:hypothetical protein ACN38_g6717 [Penicillium nordicum]